MIRKFECKNCKKHFESDDAGQQVQCPYCGSDNVEYVSFYIPSIIWKIVCAIAILLILGCIIFKIDWNVNVCQNSVFIQDEERDTIDIVRDSTYRIETGNTPPTVICVEDLRYENDGYTFDVKIENPPLVRFYIAVLHPFDNQKVIAKADDGKFKQVPNSDADGGVFDIALIDMSTDTIICKIDKPGFIRQKAVSNKMTVSELQTRIDNRDNSLMGIGENDYLSPNYKIKFVRIPNDAVNVPSTLGEIFDKLENEIWLSVKVNSLEYDDMNRISKIVLSVSE